MSIMPDPTFYPSPGMAMKAAPEQFAYVALLNVGKNGKRDAVGVIDLEPRSSTYGQLLGQVDFPGGDNELHHFGWNACSACLCPQAPHPHMERRYLIVPGIGSSLKRRATHRRTLFIVARTPSMAARSARPAAMVPAESS